MERRDTCSYHLAPVCMVTAATAVELGAAVTAVTASTVATGDAPGTADAAVGGAIVERHLRSISLASFVKSI
uniref:Uncharacterized protein n=1 Tax=Hyaloperonospora arabidopsidis (strain Emoy2) TaxID=559515 RepID=M4BPV8_HYAAE